MSTLKKEDDLVKQQANGKWNTIGTLDDNNNMLIIYRSKDKHLMRMLNGYGLSEEALNSGWFDKVVINENDNGRFYLIPVEDFLSRGIPYNAQGYEKQVVMPLALLEEYDLEKLRAQQDANHS